MWGCKPSALEKSLSLIDSTPGRRCGYLSDWIKGPWPYRMCTFPFALEIWLRAWSWVCFGVDLCVFLTGGFSLFSPRIVEAEHTGDIRLDGKDAHDRVVLDGLHSSWNNDRSSGWIIDSPQCSTPGETRLDGMAVMNDKWLGSPRRWRWILSNAYHLSKDFHVKSLWYVLADMLVRTRSRSSRSLESSRWVVVTWEYIFSLNRLGSIGKTSTSTKESFQVYHSLLGSSVIYSSSSSSCSRTDVVIN